MNGAREGALVIPFPRAPVRRPPVPPHGGAMARLAQVVALLERDLAEQQTATRELGSALAALDTEWARLEHRLVGVTEDLAASARTARQASATARAALAHLEAAERAAGSASEATDEQAEPALTTASCP